MITGTIVKTIGKPRNMKDIQSWEKACREELEPTSPQDGSEKDGLVYLWQREMNDDRLFIGPWTLTTRPVPERHRSPGEIAAFGGLDDDTLLYSEIQDRDDSYTRQI